MTSRIEGASIAPIVAAKKTDNALIRVIKIVGRVIGAIFKAIGLLFQRIFRIGIYSKDHIPEQLQNLLNRFTRNERVPEPEGNAPIELTSHKVIKISTEEDLELTRLVSEGKRVIQEVVTIGIETNKDKLEKVDEINNLLPQFSEIIPPLKDFLTNVGDFLGKVVEKKDDLDTLIPQITEKVGERFLTSIALLLKGSGVIQDGEEVSPYTEAFSKIITIFTAHLKHHTVYLEKIKSWNTLFMRAENVDNSGEEVDKVRKMIQELGREKAYQTGAITVYDDTHSKSMNNLTYTHKHVSEMIAKDGSVDLKQVCNEIAEQIVISFDAGNSEEELLPQNYLPNELVPLAEEGLDIIKNLYSKFGSSEKKYVTSASKGILVAGIAYGLEKLFDMISDPNYLKRFLYDIILPKIEEQIILSFSRQIIAAEIDNFAPLFFTESFQKGGVDEEIYQQISLQIHESLNSKTKLYQKKISEEQFQTIIHPLFIDIKTHFHGETIMDIDVFKAGLLELFVPEKGVQDKNFAEIAFDTAFTIGELQVEGITGLMIAPFKGTLKTKLSELISDQVEPYRKSYKKSVDLIADSIQANLGDRESVQRNIFDKPEEIEEEKANEILKDRIRSISKIVHDLVSWNIPQSGVSGWAAKKAITQSLGTDEEKLFVIIKKVIGKVLGVTTQKDELVEGNKFTNQNLIFHLFDTAVSALTKSKNRCNLQASIEHIV